VAGTLARHGIALFAICLPPSSITLELPIREAALGDRALPASAKTP
jgi:hypothetical protein